MRVKAARLELAEAFRGVVPADRRLQLPVISDCVGVSRFRVCGLGLALPREQRWLAGARGGAQSFAGTEVLAGSGGGGTGSTRDVHPCERICISPGSRLAILCLGLYGPDLRASLHWFRAEDALPRRVILSDWGGWGPEQSKHGVGAWDGGGRGNVGRGVRGPSKKKSRCGSNRVREGGSLDGVARTLHSASPDFGSLQIWRAFGSPIWTKLRLWAESFSPWVVQIEGILEGNCSRSSRFYAFRACLRFFKNGQLKPAALLRRA